MSQWQFDCCIDKWFLVRIHNSQLGDEYVLGVFSIQVSQFPPEPFSLQSLNEVALPLPKYLGIYFKNVFQLTNAGRGPTSPKTRRDLSR